MSSTAQPVPDGLAMLEMLDRIPIHDVDTHLVEVPDTWTSRILEPKWRDDIPRLVRDERGQLSWLVGGQRAMRAGSMLPIDKSATGPVTLESMPAHPFYDEISWRGGFDAAARLTWMDTHGIQSQVLYPNMVGFFIKAFVTNLSPELATRCLQAYNDYQTEFCSAAPTRLFALTNLPWWDLDAAIAELHRCIDMGHKGVNFGWRFEQLGFPRLRDDHWSPLLSAIQESGQAINFHVGFAGDPDDDPALQFDTRLDPLDRAGNAAALFAGNIQCITELIVSGICHKYPRQNFVSVESGVGFMPYLVDALDWQFQNQNIWRRHPDWLMPSDYFRRQIYGCFWFERSVLAAADVYPDNFMFETDFNHPTSLTPAKEYPYVKSPRDTIVANLSGASEELLRKLLHDNAARVYHLPD